MWKILSAFIRTRFHPLSSHKNLATGPIVLVTRRAGGDVGGGVGTREQWSDLAGDGVVAWRRGGVGQGRVHRFHPLSSRKNLTADLAGDGWWRGGGVGGVGQGGLRDVGERHHRAAGPIWLVTWVGGGGGEMWGGGRCFTGSFIEVPEKPNNWSDLAGERVVAEAGGGRRWPGRRAGWGGDVGGAESSVAPDAPRSSLKNLTTGHLVVTGWWRGWGGSREQCGSNEVCRFHPFSSLQLLRFGWGEAWCWAREAGVAGWETKSAPVPPLSSLKNLTTGW